MIRVALDRFRATPFEVPERPARLPRRPAVATGRTAQQVLETALDWIRDATRATWAPTPT